MIPKRLLLLFLCLFFQNLLIAQSITVLQSISQEKVLTKGQAAYLVATYTKKISAHGSYLEAFNLFSETFFKGGSSDEAVSLGEFAHLILQATKMSKNMWYKVAPSQHYALQELKKRGIIRDSIEKKASLSGETALRIFSILLEQEDLDG